MNKKTKKKKLIQWHPAFYAGIQIELANEAHKLTFENEHALSSKPKLIDILIIKKNADDKIQKNNGRIFRKHNIIEYKSPVDYLNIDDFYKVYGYTCFYKSSSKKQDEIPADDITITFICKNYPRKLLNHLISFRDMNIEQVDNGIYYLMGDIFPMQLIVTSKLSEKNNLWLKELTNELKSDSEVDTLVREYRKHENEELYKSVMNVIIRANNKKFEEAKDMCEALRELFKDELKESYESGIERGIEGMIEACKSLGVAKDVVFNMVMEKFDLSDDEAENYMERYW